MHTTVTVKLEAHTHEELINTFAGQVLNARTHFESLRDEGVFGPPETCTLRYLVKAGTHCEELNVAEAAEAAALEETANGPQRPEVDDPV